MRARRAKLIDTTVQTQPPYFISPRETAFQVSDERPLGFRASFGSSLRYNLPFDFPFINRRYSSVRLFANGLIAMDVPDFRGCTDPAAFQKVNGIAPLWMALRRNRRAQPNEDIYVSHPNSDAITFRWAAETEPFGPFSAPEPVNFAVTLFCRWAHPAQLWIREQESDEQPADPRLRHQFADCRDRQRQ